MNANKILTALAYNSECTFVFDVTTGLIENDIITAGGVNYNRKIGFSSPCSFNDLLNRFFGDEIKYRILNSSKIKNFSSEYLSDLYLSGELRCEINVFYPETNAYYRNLYFLYEDENSGHIMSYVICRKITEVEDAMFTSGGEKRADRAKIPQASIRIF